LRYGYFFHIVPSALFLGNRFYGTHGRAGAAADTGVGIDNTLVTFFADRVYRAFAFARGAIDASIRNFVSHNKTPYQLIFLKNTVKNDKKQGRQSGCAFAFSGVKY
jgi:hypothetical protein